MKYIRTEDGHILEVGVTNEYGFVVMPECICVCHFLDGKTEFVKVIERADTIEELCDRFIAQTCDITEFWVEPTLENAKMYCGIENIYGAIWTSKGLIYVAKMNSDGKLELI